MTSDAIIESAQSQVESSKSAITSTKASRSYMIEPDEPKSAATQIVGAVLNEEGGLVELWHTSEGGCHISLHYPDGHVEHRSMKAKATKQWLGGLYYDKTDKVANSSAISAAITVLEGCAMKGPLYSTYS
jgi:hypothetical protein